MNRSELAKFLRFHAAAWVATLFDFGIYYGLLSLTRFRPDQCTWIGSAVGALINFLVSYYWVFPKAGTSKNIQHSSHIPKTALKYALVSAGSAFLNGYCVGFLVDSGWLGAKAARPIAALFVSLFYNFPLHRFVVFR